jgi:hypothetical protein
LYVNYKPPPSFCDPPRAAGKPFDVAHPAKPGSFSHFLRAFDLLAYFPLTYKGYTHILITRKRNILVV